MNAHIVYSARQSLIAAVLIALLGVTSFFAFEPQVGRAITDDFIVTQQITDEISFLVAAADVSMVSSIAGVTGGSATGTTMIVVRSNDSLGYNMTLHFSSSTAMNQNGGTSYINNYTPTVVGTPDWTWVNNSTGQPAEFGYSVSASSALDVATKFRDNGTSACNTGSSNTTFRCWMNPSTTPETIINRTSATGNGGATTTLIFHVAVPNAPTPALSSGTYTATGTLTATNN